MKGEVEIEHRNSWTKLGDIIFIDQVKFVCPILHYLPIIANGFIMCFAKSSLASVKKDRTLSSGALPLCSSSITVPPGVMKADTRSELNLSTTRRNLKIEARYL